MTLKDLWESRGILPTTLAGQAGISVPTLYKIARKEHALRNNVKAVCDVLGISLAEYQQLEAETKGVKH